MNLKIYAGYGLLPMNLKIYAGYGLLVIPNYSKKKL